MHARSRAYLLACMVTGLLLLLTAQAVLSANLVTNPGFESGSTGWPTNASYWGVVSGGAHSGSLSMRLSNSSTSVYPIIRKSVPVQVDTKYTFSAWVKTQNVVGTETGAAIALEYYDAYGNYIAGGSYPAGIKGTSTWTRLSATTERVPSNVKQVHLLLYLRKGCTGTAWFDDVNVETLNDFAFRALITNPHYRNTILPGQTNRLTLGIQAAGNASHPTSSLAIDAFVTGPTGLMSSASGYPSANSTNWAYLSVNLPGTTAGTYRVDARLVDAATRTVLASKQIACTLASPTSAIPKVYIDSSNRCIVNGQPFFPLGLYCWGSYTEGLSYLNRLQNSRFNCIMNYTIPWYTLSQIKSFLDTANSKGIKAIFSVKDCYDGSTWEMSQAGPWTGTLNVLKGMVNTYKSHPAVLAWYINDELSGNYLPAITERYNWIVANDYNHPVWQVLYKGQDLSAHVDNTDVLGVDHYPVWNQCLSRAYQPIMEGFGQASDDVRRATMAARGAWMVPECASVDAPNTPYGRPPTYKEIMCEAYQALTSGARGLIFYNLTELVQYNGEAQWTTVKQVGEELYRISSIVLGADPAESAFTTASDSRIRLITRAANGSLYTLVVNPYNQTISTTFTIGSGTSARFIQVGAPGYVQRTIGVSYRRFYDRIEPYGTRVYRLVP